MAPPELSSSHLAEGVCPRHAAGSDVRVRADGIAVVHLDGRYLELSRRAFILWRSFDGTRDRVQIKRLYREGFGVDGSAAIDALIDSLAERGFITLGTLGIDGWTPCAKSLPPAPSPLSIADLLEMYVTWSPERALEAMYRRLRWIFHPVPLFVLFAITVAGALVFGQLPHPLLRVTPSVGIALGAALLVATIVHEAGHALPLRHFGATARRAGIGFYWFTPTAFVDTSAAHLLDRKHRILVTLGGPLASLVVAGLASLIAGRSDNPTLAGIAWTVAAITYAGLLWNMNPLIELDGYFLLVDLLGKPNLRSESFHRLLTRRLDGISAFYAFGAVGYSVFFVFGAVPMLVRRTLVPWFTPILPHALTTALPVAFSLLAGLATLAMIRKTAAGASPDRR